MRIAVGACLNTAAGKRGIKQPIVLTSQAGVVFTNAEGKVLTRGYKLVKPLKEPNT